jgi:sentrin-specific protease 1
MPFNVDLVTDITPDITDTHVQLARERNNGATKLKRQKLRSGSKNPRPRSVGNEHRKGGRGDLDFTGCFTEDDYKKRTDDYWAPPELGLLKSSTLRPERTPELDSDGEKASHELLHRRRSDPSFSSRSNDSMSPPLRAPEAKIGFSPMLPISKPSRTLDYSSWGKYRSPAKDNGATLEERMNTLLLTSDDQKEPAFLSPSEFIIEKRLKLAKERKLKEREAAIRVAKELRLTRRSPLKALIQPLSSYWETAVDNAQWTSNPHRVITTTIGGTELRLKDFQTLLGRNAWLNDEIINSYIEWVVDASNRAAAAAVPQTSGESASKVPKFIAHNSFFYENLIKKGPSSTQGLMRRKKAPGTSLMEVDSVFVPICRGSHWTVGAVRPVAKTIEYFDSMGGSAHQFISLMRGWLEFQLGDSYVEEEWKVPRTACARQTNGYDCGVFVCTNAFCVALGLDTLCYRESDMTQQRRNIAAVLINRGFTGDFDFAQGGLI